MPDRLVIPPVSEPVTLAEAKDQCSIETTEFDDFLMRTVRAAREHVEQRCGRALIQQTWEMTSDSFPHRTHPGYLAHSCGSYGLGYGYGYGLGYAGPCKACDLYVELSRGQLADVTAPVVSVKYVDLAGVEKTLVEGTDYAVDATNVPGRVHLAFGKSWPQARRQWDAVKVRYVVGWADDQLPESLKQAVLLLVSQMFEHRVPEVDSRALTPVLFSFEALITPHRLFHL